MSKGIFDKLVRDLSISTAGRECSSMDHTGTKSQYQQQKPQVGFQKIGL